MEMLYRCLYTEENKEHVQFREHDWLVAFILPNISKFTTKLPGWLCTALSVQLLQENELRF